MPRDSAGVRLIRVDHRPPLRRAHRARARVREEVEKHGIRRHAEQIVPRVLEGLSAFVAGGDRERLDDLDPKWLDHRMRLPVGRGGEREDDGRQHHGGPSDGRVGFQPAAALCSTHATKHQRMHGMHQQKCVIRPMLRRKIETGVPLSPCRPDFSLCGRSVVKRILFFCECRIRNGGGSAHFEELGRP